jgi:hypothetical protein
MDETTNVAAMAATDYVDDVVSAAAFECEIAPHADGAPWPAHARRLLGAQAAISALFLSPHASMSAAAALAAAVGPWAPVPRYDDGDTLRRLVARQWLPVGGALARAPALVADGEWAALLGGGLAVLRPTNDVIAALGAALRAHMHGTGVVLVDDGMEWPHRGGGDGADATHPCIAATVDDVVDAAERALFSHTDAAPRPVPEGPRAADAAVAIARVDAAFHCTVFSTERTCALAAAFRARGAPTAALGMCRAYGRVPPADADGLDVDVLDRMRAEPGAEGVCPATGAVLCDHEQAAAAAVVLPRCATLDDFLAALRCAYAWAKTLVLPRDGRALWPATRVFRRLAISPLGVAQFVEMRGAAEAERWLAAGYIALRDLDARVSAAMDVPRSARLTAAAPHAAAAALAGVAPGCRGAATHHFVRMIVPTPAVAARLRAAGHDVDCAVAAAGDEYVAVVDVPARPQLRRALAVGDEVALAAMLQRAWADNAALAEVEGAYTGAARVKAVLPAPAAPRALAPAEYAERAAALAAAAMERMSVGEETS